MSRDTRPRSGSWLRVGFLADGVFKLVVASIYVVLLQVMTDVLDAAPWLLVATATLVATSGIAEITFALRNGSGSHTRYLVAYDSGWVIVTVIAALLAFNDVLGAGTLWLVYQLLASPLVAVLFARGARRARSLGLLRGR